MLRVGMPHSFHYLQKKAASSAAERWQKVKTGEVAAEVEKLIRPVLVEEALEVWGVEYKKGTGRGFLRVYIDSEKGVDVDTCAHVSGVIGRLLGDAGLLDGPYNLEVSSPGIERTLFRPRDYQRFVGSRIRVKTREKIGNRRVFTGELRGAEEKEFTIECEDGVRAIAYTDVAKAKLVVDVKF